MVWQLLVNPVDISFIADYYSGLADRITKEIGGLLNG